MKKTILIALFCAAVAQAGAAIIPFDLQGKAGFGMLPGNENPASASTGSGGEFGTGILYDDVSNLLTLNVHWGSSFGFSDLTGTVTAAHIHQAANALLTTNGGVIISLDGVTPGFSNSPTSGGWTNTTVTLSAAQETALLSGFLYLNAHTAANGGGEIRGNLIPVPEPGTLLWGAALGLAAGIRRVRSRRA